MIDKLKEWKESNVYTYEEIAEIWEITASHTAKIFQLKARPSKKLLKRIAKITGLDYGRLVGWYYKGEYEKVKRG